MPPKGKFRQGKFIPTNSQKYKGSHIPRYLSGWERTFMEWCDSSPKVLEWMSEEPQVKYKNPITGTIWNYHPDFVIRIKDSNGIRTEMIEIKPKRETFAPVKSKGKRRQTLIEETKRWMVNIEKWKAAKKFCNRHGWVFKVMYLETKTNAFMEAKHIRLSNLDTIIIG